MVWKNKTVCTQYTTCLLYTSHRDEQMNIIVDEADRLTALVSSVMELSKVTSGTYKCCLLYTSRCV